MALFRSETPDAPAPRGGSPAEQHNLIGASTVVEGALRSSGNLNISGTVAGNVAVEGRTILMPGGTVEGEVVSTQAEIAGRITGTLTVRERLVLKGTAVVEGDIRAGTLVVEDGAVFNGRCEMGRAASPAGTPPADAPPTLRRLPAAADG